MGPEKQNWATKQANRLRHPRNLGENGKMQYPLAAPPCSAQVQREVYRGEHGTPKKEGPGFLWFSFGAMLLVPMLAFCIRASVISSKADPKFLGIKQQSLLQTSLGNSIWPHSSSSLDLKAVLELIQ